MATSPTADQHLSAAIDNVMDALSFTLTHSLDADFRAHPNHSVPNVAALQVEQEQRVGAMYGGTAASPALIADTLEELYKADAATLGVPGGCVVDFMTEPAAKIFKKEMKNRIHEWEGAFKDTFGREPQPPDKSRLRPIYELYKAVKLKVVGKGTTTNAAPPTPTKQHYDPAHGATKAAPLPSQQPQDSGKANPQPHAHPHPQSHSHAQHSTSSDGGGPSTKATTTGPPPPQHGTRNGDASLTAVSSTHSLGSRKQSLSSDEFADIQAEKRSLKKRLHAFEDHFKTTYGRAPTKDDRRTLHAEYQRYAELKAVLAEE